jgi:hypothetical protein
MGSRWNRWLRPSRVEVAVDSTHSLLERTAGHAADFLEGLTQRPVASSARLNELRAALRGARVAGGGFVRVDKRADSWTTDGHK